MFRGLIYAVVSACCFGVLPILAKLGYAQGMGAFEMLAWRFGGGFVLLSLWLAVKHPQELQAKPRTLFKALALGAILYPLQSACFLLAIKYIPAATTTLILYFYPLCVTLLSALIFHTRLTRAVVLSLVLVTAGCILVFYQAFTQNFNTFGLVLAVGAMVVMSCYFIVSQVVLRNEPALTVALYQMAATSIIFCFLDPPSLAHLTWKTGLLAGALGLFPSALAIGLLYKSIEAIGSAYASIFSTTEPITTVILSCAVLDEPLALLQVAGTACIVAGIVVPNIALLRKPKALATR